MILGRPFSLGRGAFLWLYTTAFVFFAQFGNDIFMTYCYRLQTEKTFKKPVDKRKLLCYNMQAVKQQDVNERPRKRRRVESEKYHEKIFEKLFKNLLTNGKRCGIIIGSRKTRLSAEGTLQQIIDN